MQKRREFDEGHTINFLTYLGDAETRRSAKGKRRAFVRVRCHCGVVTEVDRYSWSSGRQHSCGCYGPETQHLRHHVHGMTGTGIYSSWCSMRERVKPGSKANTGNYVGVKCDPRWKTFVGFLANQPAGRKHENGLQLARFGDVGDYTPENTRWATISENSTEAANRRKVLLPDGRFAADVARENGIGSNIWANRYYTLGWDLLDAVTRPVARRATRPHMRRHAATPQTSP